MILKGFLFLRVNNFVNSLHNCEMAGLLYVGTGVSVGGVRFWVVGEHTQISTIILFVHTK
ncbi:MAG: hypothetical protein RI924_511 [Bacteroidota bacterium]|jgi:hypothetical protein